MIFLTGDVHTRIAKNWEQKNSSELDSAIKYLEILKKHNISCTFFINGISFKEESGKVEEFLKYDVELGGHTYDNFGNMNVFKGFIYRKLWKCLYGPSSFQRKDIKKTRQAFEEAGLQMKSWRTHAFASNENTFQILRENKVRFVSDLLGNQKSFEKERIIHMPINIPVDQNTISYGILKPENRDCFVSCTKGRIMPDEWFEILKKRIQENEKNNFPSILLIHPQTMFALDNFKLFEKIASFLASYNCRRMSEFEI